MIALIPFLLSVLLAEDPAPERPWTLMVYGAADNDADGPILRFLDQVRAALDDDPGMELILFIDRSAGHSDDASSLGAEFAGARVFRLRRDEAEELDASSHFPGLTPGADVELDSSDPQNLGRFVAFARERFPARRYGLMIYSHADGCTMCPDGASGRDMHVPELAREVGPEASVDFLALELCNMGGIEIAYEWRPGRPADAGGGFAAEILVAIPNAGPPLDWDRAFARIRTPGHGAPEGVGEPVLDPAAMTALDFGRLVIEEGERGRVAMAEAHPREAERVGREAAACYDLRRAEAVKRAVDRFARELSLQPGTQEILEGLRDGAGGEGPVLNYVQDRFGPRPYVDLFALAERASACDELDRETRGAAADLCAAVDELVVASFGMPGLKGFQPGRHGIFIAFPDGDGRRLAGLLDGAGTVWQAMDWYTPLTPPTPNGGDRGRAPYGRWSFLADGATSDDGVIDTWFELLDSWFDDPMAATGGHNGYLW